MVDGVYGTCSVRDQLFGRVSNVITDDYGSSCSIDGGRQFLGCSQNLQGNVHETTVTLFGPYPYGGLHCHLIPTPPRPRLTEARLRAEQTQLL